MDSKSDRVRDIDLPAIRHALDSYAHKSGHLPEDLNALVLAHVIQRVPTDPWDRDYAYQRGDGVIRIASLGKDGLDGGEGLNADIEFLCVDAAFKAPGGLP